MSLLPYSLDRRAFFAAGALGLAVPFCDAAFPRSTPPARPDKPRKKVALITTAYHYLSHAYHIGGRFLSGYLKNNQMHFPDYAIAGMYVAQQKDNDLSKTICKRHDIPLFPDIAGALTLGGDKLAVDGVLLIGEHGDFPYNDKGQKLYPRYEMFTKVVEVFDRSKRVVPVFCDKHLYYDRTKARSMYETARKRKIPLYAGSSLPITWRRPELELPLDVELEDTLICSRGELEVYGIHALEALQCMVERRKGAEQGVKAITCYEGEEVWKAGDKGVWSWELLEHALGRSESRNVGSIRDNCQDFAPPPGRPSFPRGPIGFHIEYRDGFKATVLIVNGHVDDTTFAARIKGRKNLVSTLFYLPPPPGAAFLEALTSKIEEFLTTGEPPYPVERTLLTGGMLDVALESRVNKGKRLETPDLAINYTAPKDSGFMRGSYTAPVEKQN